MSRGPAAVTADLVPVAERVRNLQVWRTVVLLLAALCVLAVPSLSVVSSVGVTAGVAAFVGASWALSTASVRTSRGGRVLVRVLLLGDAAAAVALTLGVGGTRSPLRFLVILQVVEATLLASFRTGLKVAAWQSLVVSTLYVVGPVVAPGIATVHLGPNGLVDVGALVAGAWIAAVSTAWLAAANERELRRRRYDLEQLARFHDAVDDAETPAAAATLFVDLVADEFDAPRVVVMLPGPRTDRTLEVVAWRGVTIAPPPTVAVGTGSMLERVRTTGSTQLVERLAPDLDEPIAALLPDARNLAVVPIRTQRGRGVAVIEHGARSGTRLEQRIVTMVERYRDDLGSRLSTLWLIESLRDAAAHDALTGLANRAHLMEVLHAASQRTVREGHPLSVAMVDVDHFKRVNDTLGHSAGDAVLVQVARALKTTVRPYDTAARYGGEEFVVVLPGLQLADAVTVAERMRAAVAAVTSPTRATISVGVAEYDVALDDIEATLRRADDALYQAKARGRDRVVSARGRRATMDG